MQINHVILNYNPNQQNFTVFCQVQQNSISMNTQGANRKLYIVDEIPNYKDSYKPSIQAQKHLFIQDKLKIQKIAKNQTDKRIGKGNHFINYYQNPLTNLKRRSHSFSISQPSLSKSRSKKKTTNEVRHSNLIEAVNQLGNKSLAKQKIDKKSLSSKKITPLINNALHVSSSINYHLHIKKVSPRIQLKKVNLSSQNPEQHLTPPKKSGKQLSRNEEKAEKRAKIMETELSLEQILDIREDNFFMKPERRLYQNLFRVARNKEDLLNGSQTLSQKHFRFDYMGSRPSGKIKPQIYRQISKLGRKIITDIQSENKEIIENMSSEDLAYRMNYLQFHSVMNVASGRLTPKYVSDTNQGKFTGPRPLNDSDSDISESETGHEMFIPYGLNTKNQNDNWRSIQEEQLQIEDYERLGYHQLEHKLEKKYRNIMERIGNLIDEKDFILKHNIHDRETIETKENIIMEKINSFLGDQSQKDLDKEVRMKKLQKNREDSIKLDKLIKIVKMKGQNRAKFEKLVRHH